MKNTSYLSFFNQILLARGPLHSKWKNKKFRLMYLLRSMISPVSSIRYYQELHSLKSIDKILEMQPTLPAKIHRPYLHKGGLAWNRRKNIIGHYRFVQNLPVKHQALLLPDRDVLLVHFTGKNGEDFDIHCSSGGFDREGELMLSLSFNNTPVARLSFSVIPSKKDIVHLLAVCRGHQKYWPRHYS